MTRLIDANRVLKGYYAMHGAIRADLVNIEAYCARLPADRQGSRQEFMDWFLHHTEMVAEHDRCEDEFFFPAFQEFLKDGGDFVEHMRQQGKDLMGMQKGIHDELLVAGQEQLAIEYLQAYVTAVRKHIEDEETICVPIMMEHFTRESLRKIEMRYVRTLGLKQLTLILPWMLTRLEPENRNNPEDGIPSLPLPIRLLYLWFWEPAYKKRFASLFPL